MIAELLPPCKAGGEARIPPVQEQARPPSKLQEQMRRHKHQGVGQSRAAPEVGKSEVPYL